jgi:hypothetical protein
MTLWPALGHAENLAKEVKKAVERSTLDRPGTRPFHLRAALAPSFERDKESGRTGEVEIWWTSHTQWKREMRSPEFHRIEIVDGAHEWQKNEGGYFPEWLQETAVELIKPVPPLDQVLEQVKGAELRRIGPMTNLSWTTPSGTAEIHNILRSSVALQNSTGLLLYAGGLGWGGEFKDYADFHGRMVARTVGVGTPQVTAKITTLEDLGEIPAGFFDTAAKGGDSQILQTVLMDETSLRRNLLPMEPLSWPPLQDGSLEGNVTTQIVVDREGKVREIGTLISENSGVNDAGMHAVVTLRFKPFLVDGVPVQVMSQLTIPFKTVRPAGAETFEKSRYVRSRNEGKACQFADGQDAGLLRLVMKMIEPIPAIDTFVESDWRIKRDTVNGVRTVRVLAGYESPEGKLDPEQSRGYWFDDTGLLLKTYFNGIETLRLEFADFAGVKTAHRIDVLKDGKLAMRIRVTEVSPAGTIPTKTFEVRGHEWTRAFTAEAR